MPISETAICNLALSLFGNSRIGDIDEQSITANLCKVWYEQTRNEVLSESGVEWVCAKTRTQLSQISDDPAFGWDYQYQLPADCLKIIGIVTDEGDIKNIPWTREADRILTNEEECYLLYIKQITDPTKFSPLLARAIYTLLASVLAARLAQNLQKSRELLLEYTEVVLSKAKMSNAEDGYLEEEEGAYDWEEAGRS